MSEPRIVVSNREHLWFLLTEAAQLEHMIMCSYLFALFSFKDGAADDLTEAQAAAVGRWRQVLHGIVVEEMLHMALVANVMAAIGAAPTFGRPNFPQSSGYFPAGFQLTLLPFDEHSLRQFLYLERPEGLEFQNIDEFVPVAPAREALGPLEAMPHGQEFATIGHLYRGIEDGLRSLCAKVGEPAVFVGSPRAQATPELFHWPQLIAVTDLASALAAVDEIIAQGEGARGDWRNAHYGRFHAIWQEYQQLRDQDPAFTPARPVLPAFLRQPFDIAAPQPLVTDPLTRRVSELAVVAYELILHFLTRFFTHTEETEDELALLIAISIRLMTNVLRPLGTALAGMPVGPEHPGRTAGFAFEMYYAMSNFVPWRDPSWALLYERMTVLGQLSAEAGALDGAPAGVAAVGKEAGALSGLIRPHVPARILPA